MQTTVVDVPERGRFEIRQGDRVLGLASYHVDDGAMTLPHTEIDPSVGGRGLGTALVAGVLAAARERGAARPPLLLLRPPLHPAASRGARPRRRGGPPALRAGHGRSLTRVSSRTTRSGTTGLHAPIGPPTLRGCRRRCCGSAATCGWPTTRPCSPPWTPRAAGRVVALFVVDPRLWEPGGRAAAARSCSTPCDDLRAADGRRARAAVRRIRRTSSRRWSARSARRSVHVVRRRRALRAAPGRGRRAGARRRAARPHRLAVRGRRRAG